jgi:hypothetical protein
MKLMLSLLFMMSLFFTSMGQTISSEVVGSAGDYYQNPSGFNLHFTIGEVAISNYETSGLILSEGFHQTYLDDAVMSIWENSKNNIDLHVFPNPASSWIKIDSDFSENLHVNISNITGQQVDKIELSANETKEVNIQNLPAGIYLLQFSNDKQLLKTVKIIKQ